MNKVRDLLEVLTPSGIHEGNLREGVFASLPFCLSDLLQLLVVEVIGTLFNGLSRCWYPAGDACSNSSQLSRTRTTLKSLCSCPTAGTTLRSF